MAFNTGAIANLILDLGAGDLSPMKLQKLLYYAHGWHLALTDEPLLDDRIEAWKWGPVIPSIYHEFKAFGNEPIGSVRAKKIALVPVDGKLRIRIQTACLPDGEESKNAKAIVERVYKTFRPYNAIQLSQMTHKPGSPWDIVWNQQGAKNDRGKAISDEIIKVHFKNLKNKI